MSIDTPLFDLAKEITRDLARPRPMVGNLLDLDSARVHRNDLDTSHEAADSNDVHGSVATVLDTLRRLGPMHDELLVTHIQAAAVFNDTPKYTEQRIRTARSTLVEKGLVINTGTKTLTSHNRRTTVWAASV